MQEIARAYLETRMEWLNVKRQYADAPLGPECVDILEKTSLIEARMRALAWALDIDPDLMDMPTPTVLPELSEMRLTRVSGTRWWLLEIPADDTPDAQTARWAEILSSAQLVELHHLITHARDLFTPSASYVTEPMRFRLVEPDAL